MTSCATTSWPDFVCDIADAALASATNSQIVPTSPRQVDVSSPLINSSLATREDDASVAPNSTDIPEDIRAKASEIASLIPSKVRSENRTFAALVIARAILAERERCAKIAENSPVQTVRDRRQAVAIAAAIRSLSNEEAQP